MRLSRNAHDLASRWGPLEIVQGYYLSQVVQCLYSIGLIERLMEWTTIDGLCDGLRIDRNLVRIVVDFLVDTTDLIQRDTRRRVRLKARYRRFNEMEFHFSKFLDAYGPCLSNLTEILRRPESGQKYVREDQLARAFDRLERPEQRSAAATLITHLGIRTLLDLGCGPGALLAELATHNPEFTGYGIDRSVAMCRLARRRVREVGAVGRVSIVCSDVRLVGSCIVSKKRDQVDALHAGSLFNEFVKAPTKQACAVQLLTKLRELFPSRILLVCDYYGQLNRKSVDARACRQTLLHDLIQALSGQGIPPPDLAGWKAIYSAAGCEVLRSYDGESSGMRWFYHIVRL
jgi:SAM-dependent methyltransferase